MNTLTTVLAILVALEHLYIMFLETIATSSESTSRVFSITNDQLKSKTISTLMKNQGVYNGLIAVLFLVAVWQQDLLWTRLLLGYVVLVALYGSLTSKPNIILKQGGLAIVWVVPSLPLRIPCRRVLQRASSRPKYARAVLGQAKRQSRA